MPCFSLKLSYDDFLKANFKKSIVLSYDILTKRFMRLAKSQAHKGVIVIRYYLALRGAENGVTVMVTPFFCVQG